jgi:hypothetical protein
VRCATWREEALPAAETLKEVVKEEEEEVVVKKEEVV